MTTERQVFADCLRHQTDENEDALTKRLMVLGLMHYWKLDRCSAKLQESKAEIPLAEAQEIVDGFTEKEHLRFQQEAESTLARYAEKHPPKRDLKFDFWFGTAQGIAAAFFWSLILVAALVIIRLNNIDVLHALGAEKAAEGSGSTGGTGSTGANGH